MSNKSLMKKIGVMAAATGALLYVTSKLPPAIRLGTGVGGSIIACISLGYLLRNEPLGPSEQRRRTPRTPPRIRAPRQRRQQPPAVPPIQNHYHQHHYYNPTVLYNTPYNPPRNPPLLNP